MADIELDNIGEDRTGQEEAEQEKQAEDRAEGEESETSFVENTDNIQSQSRANIGLDEDDLAGLEKQIQDHAIKKAIQRYDTIQALETATDTKFSVTHGDSSKEIIDNISDIKYNEKGKLIALKFKGEDVKLTAKGGINKSATVQNKDILKAIDKAKVEYDKSIASVVDETLDISLSDEAIASVQESIAERVEDLVWDKYKEIS